MSFLRLWQKQLWVGWRKSYQASLVCLSQNNRLLIMHFSLLNASLLHEEQEVKKKGTHGSKTRCVQSIWQSGVELSRNGDKIYGISVDMD